MLVCMGIGRIFSRECTSRFLKKFFQGGKSGEFCFLPLTTKKTVFFAEIFQNPALFRHPCLCVGKVRATPLKTSVIILNSEILLNLIRKMKYLADQFQLCFCFCIVQH